MNYVYTFVFFYIYILFFSLHIHVADECNKLIRWWKKEKERKDSKLCLLLKEWAHCLFALLLSIANVLDLNGKHQTKWLFSLFNDKYVITNWIFVGDSGGVLSMVAVMVVCVFLCRCLCVCNGVCIYYQIVLNFPFSFIWLIDYISKKFQCKNIATNVRYFFGCVS